MERPRIQVFVDGLPVGVKPNTYFEFWVEETDTAVMDRHQRDEHPFIVHPMGNTISPHEASFVAPVPMESLPYEIEIRDHKILIEKTS